MVENKIKKQNLQERENTILIRILGMDVRSDSKLFSELTKIKGISWSFANAICKNLKLDKNKKVQEMSKVEIKKLETFMEDPKVPSFLKNRQNDFDGGKDKHLVGADLKLRKEFDIKRLRKIRSYRGIRHAVGLPVRGQRTKSNFRKNRKKSGSIGIKSKK